MGKLINTDKLDRLSKALDNRIKVTAEELSSLIDDVREMLGGRSLVYLTKLEYDALSEEDQHDEYTTYFITDAEDLSHEHENKEFLDSLIEGNLNADTINGYKFWIGTTEELEAVGDKDSNTIYYELSDGIEVVQVDVVDGVLNLTDDKYQKTTMVDGTELVFPDVSGFTEIHLYFSSDENMSLTFPDCKWRVDPNIEAGSSYEIVAVYNTIEWLLNCISYS